MDIRRQLVQAAGQYVFAEQLANGKLSNDSVITGIQLEYALQTVLENSSGPSFYSMVSHLGGNTVSNCAELVPQYAGLPEDYYTDDSTKEAITRRAL